MNMEKTETSEIWFPEPENADNTWAKEGGEGTFSWLERSTLPRACAAREFLNSNLTLLPEEFANKLRRDLAHRWQSAFFELIVARTLQVLGGSLSIEESTASARLPFSQVSRSCVHGSENRR